MYLVNVIKKARTKKKLNLDLLALRVIPLEVRRRIKLTGAELEEYRQIFSLFDQTGQGKIGWADLGRQSSSLQSVTIQGL